jgi:hypothetical protein
MLVAGECFVAFFGSCTCQYTHTHTHPRVFAHLVAFCFSMLEGNRNAGGSYTKAVAAIAGLDFEVTAENAMGLSKAKTKVANIGKASAEKMKEFLETGKMAKLEEKRAANA